MLEEQWFLGADLCKGLQRFGSHIARAFHLQALLVGEIEVTVLKVKIQSHRGVMATMPFVKGCPARFYRMNRRFEVHSLIGPPRVFRARGGLRGLAQREFGTFPNPTTPATRNKLGGSAGPLFGPISNKSPPADIEQASSKKPRLRFRAEAFQKGAGNGARVSPADGLRFTVSRCYLVGRRAGQERCRPALQFGAEAPGTAS
jgi:hypothetical protein